MDIFEAIKKYNELLDMGAITQEEFDEKKAKLLSIGAENDSGSAETQKTEEPELSILLTGCVPCQPELIEKAKKYRKTFSYNDCFSLMKEVFDGSDLAIGSVCTEYDYPGKYLSAMKNAGFDVMSLGIGPYEEQKAAAMRKALSEHGLKHTNGGSVGSFIFNEKGIKVGIVDCTINEPYDDLRILSEAMNIVGEMDEEKVDVKICYVYWNFQLQKMIDLDERQRAIAKVLAGIGFDYITGAGPLTVMKYETLEGGWNRRVPVAYSLGNFIYVSGQLNYLSSAVIRLKLKKQPSGRISISDSYLPCFTWGSYGGKRSRVQFLNDRTYLYNATKNTAEWRKMYISSKLGDGIPLCHEFDVKKEDPAKEAGHVDGIQDQFARARLAAPSDLHMVILDSYRLTDEFRKTYGRLLYSDDAYSGIIQGAEHYLRCKYPQILKREDVKDIIVDMIYSKTVLDFSYTEYFGYHLMDKSIQERVEYISDMFRLNYYLRLNTDVDENHILDNKWSCYERLKDLYKREIINITSKEDFNIFAEYAAKYDRFMVKPTDGSLGQGIRIIDRKDYDDVEKLFNGIFDREGPFICEELIISQDYLSEIHPESCNSIRVFSYNSGEDIKFVCAWLKAGRGDNIVDNGGAGGVVAAINMDTGVIEYDASDEAGQIFEQHPDTGVSFKGIKIKDWEELKELVRAAAAEFPTVKMIAWDVAHGERGWQLIEGNSQGQMWIYQLSSGKGMRKEMEELIDWQN